VPKLWLTEGMPAIAAASGAASDAAVNQERRLPLADAREQVGEGGRRDTLAEEERKRDEGKLRRRDLARLDDGGRRHRSHLGRGRTRSQRVEAVTRDALAKVGAAGERDLVAALQERARQRTERMKVPVSRCSDEQDAHAAWCLPLSDTGL